MGNTVRPYSTVQPEATSRPGGGAVSGGSAPDLRESPIPLTLEAFRAVLVDGARVANGMPRFKDFTTRELEALRHYLRKQAVILMRVN